MHRQVCAALLLVLATFAGFAQPASALTGIESISASNVETDAMDITATNLDVNDAYRWNLFVYFPSGSLCASDVGYMTQNVQSTMTDSAHWGPCTQQGNYTFSLRLLKTSNSQILDYHNGTYYSNGTNSYAPQDWYEQNDGKSAAVQINTFTNYTNLTIHSYSNEDWYWFNVTGNQNVWINLTHDHSQMDAILYAYKDQGGGFKSQLDHSDTELDWEQAFFNSSTTNSTVWTILIKVLATGGAAGYNMSIEHANRATPAKNIADQYEPNEDIAGAHSITIPFSSQSATIHNGSDEDFYSFSVINGERYWFNLSFIDSGGDLELYLQNSSGGTLDSSTSSTSNEQIIWTATANGTFYLRVDGHSGDTNTYRLEIDTNSTVPQAPLVTGSLDCAFLDLSSSWMKIYNTTASTNYTVDWSLTRGTGAGFTWVENGTFNWSAFSNTTVLNTTRNHDKLWLEDFWCISASLDGELNGTTVTNLDSFIDCQTPTFQNVTFLSDWKAQIDFSELEASSNYFYEWKMQDFTGTNIHKSGNNSISTSPTGAASSTASWNYLTQGANCLVANLWAANGTLIEQSEDCFSPTLPIVNLTAFDNTTINVSASQLFNNGPWRVQVEVETFQGIVIHTTSNRTWTGNTTHAESWSWTPVNSSGWYCAFAYLYSQNGSLWDVSSTCIQLNFDDDGDGVLNEDDWCNNTLPGYTVDLNGCADYQKDSDNDGYTDDVDAFPWDHTEWNDTDSDGHGDNSDAFPNDPNEWEDSDEDGHGDNGDAFPNDPNEWDDSDGDGCGDNGDVFPNDPSECDDSDGDGHGDNSDAFPSDSEEWADSDGDGCGDNSDEFPNNPAECADTDGDGVGDNSDAFPADGNETADTDGDGVGDNGDAFPADPAEWSDSDGDGVGDNSDACPDTGIGATVDSAGCDDTQRDTDADGVKDAFDSCPSTPIGETPDASGCSPSQRDTDDDSITDDRDQCPTTAPGAQVNGVGCAADERDTDSDGIVDADDLCNNTPGSEDADSNGCAPSQKDSDSDSITDDLDECPGTGEGAEVDLLGCADTQRDRDDDGVVDAEDLCPSTQANLSVNTEGCAANERDTDGDGVVDSLDDCPGTVEISQRDFRGCTPHQKDGDADGVSDADDTCRSTPPGEPVDLQGCSPTQKDSDLDGYMDAFDDFPLDPSYHSDRDGDGVADELDFYPNDASRSVEEESSSNVLIYVIIALLSIIIIGGAAIFMRMNSVAAEAEDKEYE